MTQVSESIVQTIESLERASSAPSLWGAMKAAATAFGYEWMLALKWSVAPPKTPLVVFNDTLAGFIEALGADEAMHANPHVSRALAEARPVSVRELFDASDGLIVPIKSEVQEGVVVLLGRAPDTSAIARSAMHLLSHCAFERAIALDSEPKRRDFGLLSPREAECLKWAAAGKTDAEIGAILSISPRTTRFHVENAKKKLGVATRIQAVAEALRLKAIAA